MVALRRVWWVLVLSLLAALGLACSSGGPGKPGGQTAGDGTTTQTDGGAEPQSGGAPVRAGDADPGADGVPCDDCQSEDDSVRLSDADGFEFETGEAEASRIDAREPAEGDEKPATFDAGQGMTGTTGSSNLRPR